MMRRFFILSLGLAALLAQAETKKQVFRLDIKQDTRDGKVHYPAVMPLIPVRLGVQQLEGAKHPDKDILTCTPGEDPAYPHFLILKCDDGSKWQVVGVEFP